MPKKYKIRSIYSMKARSKNIKIAKKWNQWYIKEDSKILICWLSTIQSGEFLIVYPWIQDTFTEVIKCVIFVKLSHLNLSVIDQSGATIIFFNVHSLSIVAGNLIPIFVTRVCTLIPYLSLFYQTGWLILEPCYQSVFFIPIVEKQISSIFRSHVK